MLNNHALLELMHLADSSLPIGGYTHSNGLETFVQQGLVHDGSSAQEYTKNMLMLNLVFNDGAFMKDAYLAAQEKALAQLLSLDQELHALKVARETREASYKLGLRLLKIYQKIKVLDHQSKENVNILNDYLSAIQAKDQSIAYGHYAISFGLLAFLLEIPLPAALNAYYYNAMAGMITNCVKMIPLGQLDGQLILYESHALIAEATEKTLALSQSERGICCPAFEIRAMQHERLYTRLYMS